jgi:hypothetical protein
MTIYINNPTKKREFVTPASVDGRSPTSTTYEFTYDQILWDDGTDIFWDDNSQILWSESFTSYPIEAQARKRNFTVIARS